MVRMTLQERSDAIRRKFGDGYILPQPELLMNNGERRTAEKRRLLQAIQDMAAKSGRTAPFKAKY